MRVRTLSTLLVVAVLGAACKAPEPPAPVAQTPAPAPKKFMTITSKSPEAVAAVTTGIDLMDNVRTAEAIQSYEKALTLDPDFALAHALLGTVTPGSEGLTHLTKAEELAATLPDAERAFIQSLAAERRGEDDKALELMRTAAAAAPDDWRLQAALGMHASARYQLAEAATAYGAATKLNPKAGSAYNSLGYTQLAQSDVNGAIATFTKYAEVSPNEPNPQDSLAEALMAAGRYEEAEAGFQKALAISATFAPAWGGIAQSRFYRGDWTGGREALAKEKETATRAVEKADADTALAWSYAAEGKMADATKTLDGLEAWAKEQNLQVTYAFLPIQRARLAIVGGKPAEAIKLTDEALARSASASLPGGPAAELNRAALTTRIEAEARLGKAADAQATLAKIEADAAMAPGNARRASMLAFARGEAALASKDAKGAAELFATCIADESYCRLEEARARKKAGDEAGAATAAGAIVSIHRRGYEDVWIESQAKPMAPVTAPAGT